MAEKRDNYRHRKRMALRFGVDAPNTTAFTEDISDEGLFIKAGLVQPVGRELQVEIDLGGGRIIRLLARVQWAKKVPPALLRSYKGGMGVRIVRFSDGEEHYRALCDELHHIKRERDGVVLQVRASVD